METAKTTTQYENKIKNADGILTGMDGIEIKGYEIHQGYSYPVNEGKTEIKCIFEDKKLKGAIKGNVVGTYIHGIFDNSEFTNHFLNEVRKLKGLDKVNEDFSFKEYKNREYDKLAQILRENVDIEKIYEIMGCE